jgi:two-component system nitrogen regulation sensor histidine kinase GlnL
LRAEDILFSIPFPVVITDGEGKILHANQKFETFVNRSIKYLQGKPLYSFFKHQEDIKKKIEESYSNLVEILGFKTDDYYLNFAPFYVSSVVKGVIVVVQPVAENPFDEDILLFLKGLSHEIRNPLSGIKGAARLFQKLKCYDEELLNVLIEETERIERLLNNVVKSFDFSSLNYEPTNVHKIIQNVVNLFRERIETEDIEVVYLFDPSLPEISVDPDRITQVLINFFKNALEAVETSEIKKITVETGYAIHPSGFIFIRLKDTGCGMDEQELKQFFVPFFTTKEKGSGLGTFIASEIVKKHGGEVKVKSEKGKGTEVTIYLPMKGY